MVLRARRRGRRTGRRRTEVGGLGARIGALKSEAIRRNLTRNSDRFSRAFLIVTPGITIRDRLQVLYPEHPDSYYRSREIVPNDMLGDVARVFLLYQKGRDSRIFQAQDRAIDDFTLKGISAQHINRSVSSELMI